MKIKQNFTLYSIFFSSQYKLPPHPFSFKINGILEARKGYEGEEEEEGKRKGKSKMKNFLFFVFSFSFIIKVELFVFGVPKG